MKIEYCLKPALGGMTSVAHFIAGHELSLLFSFLCCFLVFKGSDFTEPFYWHAASGTQVLHSFINDDPGSGLTLTYFTARSNLVT